MSVTMRVTIKFYYTCERKKGHTHPLSDIEAGDTDHDLLLHLRICKLCAYIALMTIESTTQAQGLKA